MSGYNWRKRYAVDKQNEERLRRLCPDIDHAPGIYFFVRENENGIKYAYIGQAKDMLKRCCEHMVGYKQHIDRSLKKHGLWKLVNEHGWRLGVLPFDTELLDQMEIAYINLYGREGYQLLNVSTGGQGGARGSGQISERKPSKGYYDGLEQGKKNLARDLRHIIELHLDVRIKPGKESHKVSQRQFERFKELLNLKEDEDVKHSGGKD